MKNITKIFLNTAPVSKRLTFGVNKNVILKDINNDEKRNKAGLVMDILATLVFAQKDPETDKIIAETAIPLFAPGNRDYVGKKFIHDILQFFSIVNEVVSDKDALKEVKDKMNAVLGSEDNLEYVTLASKLNASGKKASEKEFKEIVKVQKNVFGEFVKILKDHTGANSDTFGLLMVTNYKGEFLGLPKEDTGFIHKNPDKIKVAAKYLRWKNNKNSAKKETAVADNIGGDEVVNVSSMQVVNSGDLSDI